MESWLLMHNTHRGKRLIALIVTVAASTTLGSCGSTGGGSVEAVASGELPIEGTLGLEREFESARHLAESADAVVIAEFRGLEQGWRFPEDPEGDVEGAVEHVGLVFSVSETISGDVAEAEADGTLVVTWPAYRHVPDGKLAETDREARVVFNGVDFLELKPGAHYMLAVSYSENLSSYQLFLSTTLAQVDEDGGLALLAEAESGFGGLELFSSSEVRREMKKAPETG